jgi:hypothetical protein
MAGLVRNAPAVTGGRGGGLATRRTAPVHPPRRLELAGHESAHAVVGVWHGAVLEFSRLAEDGLSGLTGFTAASFEQAGPAGARLQIAAAGAVCEARMACGGRPTVAAVEARLCGSDRAEFTDEGMRSLRRVPVPVAEVDGLLSRKRVLNAVSSLAGDLYDGVTLSHADVVRALRLDDEGGPHSLALFKLRGGW